MVDASAIFDRLLSELPRDLAAFRDLAPAPRLARCVTLSTFHGCPAQEIEAIVQRMSAPERTQLVATLTMFAQAAGEVPEQDWSLGWGASE